MKDADMNAVVVMADVPKDDENPKWEVELEDGWDVIDLSRF